MKIGKECKFNLTLKQRLQRLLRALSLFPIGYDPEGEYYGLISFGDWIEYKIDDLKDVVNGYWIGAAFEE